MSLQKYFSLVKFSHSIFALPFALMSAWLAAGGLPALQTLGLVVAAAVSARTAAMGFNRLVDRKIDAVNPRTMGREIPQGTISPAQAGGLIVGSASLFVGASFALNPLCGWLSPFVLLVLLGYSFAKRFTVLVHFWLGLALGLAPPAAWLAVRGHLNGDLSVPVLLGVAVLSWVSGFDLIYSCQDSDFDAKRGLHSVPARFGVPRALAAARLLHSLTVVLLGLVAWHAELSWIFLGALLFAAMLLVWEHSIVSAEDLSRVDRAFFTLNGWVSIGLFLGTVFDLWIFGGEIL